MSLEIDPEEFISFKAETKNELKWIRREISKANDNLKDLNTKVTELCSDITMLKTKALIYAAIGGFIISALLNIGLFVLKGD
jgi:hypothetical protein